MPKRLREEPTRPRSPVLAPLSAIAARRILDGEEGTATKAPRIRDREGGDSGRQPEPEPEPVPAPVPAVAGAAGPGFVQNAGNYIVHEDRTVSIRFMAGEVGWARPPFFLKAQCEEGGG